MKNQKQRIVILICSLLFTLFTVIFHGTALAQTWEGKAAAWERIGSIRKRDISITILSDSGLPVENVLVKVELKRHAFNFGVVLRSDVYLGSPYKDKYEEAKTQFDKKRFITIGAGEAASLTLYSSDWQGDYCDNIFGLLDANAVGYWDIDVAKSGLYEIELRRWSEESRKRITDSVDGKSEKGAIPAVKARLRIGSDDMSSEIELNDTAIRFITNLEEGKSKLSASFLDQQDEVICGAMYVKIIRK